jgi:hypothetical protein
MRLGIMQPYFFPHLGYFSLIDHCDEWVVFDVTQYTPKTWMNRNRVLHPREGWNWVGVTLENSSRSISIAEARLADPASALTTLLGKVSHYRHKAPYWREVEAILEASLGEPSEHSLVAVNVRGISEVCEYIGVDFRPGVCSALDLELPTIDHPGGWAPAIASVLGADEYCNPIGGRGLFDPEEFASHGVRLSFLEQPPFVYETAPYEFEPQLSVLDVLMWNDPTAVRAAIAGARCIAADAALAC